MPTDSRRYLIAAALVLLLGSGGEYVRVTRVPPAAYHPTFAEVPLSIGDYQGKDVPIDESIYRFLAASGMLERRYEGPEGGVQMTILYASDWRSVHSPAGCFPAQGWEIVSDDPVSYDPPRGSGITSMLHARLLRLHKDDKWLMAMFSFAYQGGTTSDWSDEGMKVARGPRGAGGLVFTLSTPLDPRDPQASVKRIGTVFATAYPGAIAFWNQPATPAAH
ncbi:MAG TPA: exosortase-associated EpsI family protein [Armatimonadota bacterium]|jgi:hypothetical protein